MLRTEPRNRDNDQAPTAILELVDGPRDMRFAITAMTVARERGDEGGDGVREVTLRNIAKVTQFRPGGEAELERAVRRMETEKGFEKEEEGGDEGKRRLGART